MSACWLLNLDADFELEKPDGYQPARAVVERIAALVPRARTLLRPGDVLLGSPEERQGPPFGDVRAWCPTPTALRAFSRAGLTPPVVPPLEVLRRVNHRRFHRELGATLPGSCWVTSADDLARLITGGSPSGTWLIKRPFGFAGRGRLRLATVDYAAQRWIDASFTRGDGVLIEPWVEREVDFAQHGYVARDGTVIVGAAITQRCDPRGAWIESALDEPVADADREALASEAREVGAALASVGYFGAFGIDAFRYRLAGESALCRRCEINARYTMGWAAGMGAARPVGA